MQKVHMTPELAAVVLTEFMNIPAVKLEAGVLNPPLCSQSSIIHFSKWYVTNFLIIYAYKQA
jgi:hypothetical protein